MSDKNATLRDLIREELEKHPTVSDTTIADDVMKRLNVAAKPRMLLLSAVAAVVGTERRSDVREIERAVFGSKRRVIDGEPVDVVEGRKTLLDETFALGDGRFVRWGEATVEDHEARIELLAKLRAGLDRTISQHVEAIAAIKAAKATCLYECEQDAA